MGRSMKGLLHSNKKKQGCLTVNPISTFKTCTSQCTCRSKSEPAEDDRHYSTSSSVGSHLLEEDMLILKVIESYCTSARARHTLNSSPIAPEIPAHTPRAMSTSSLRNDWKRKSKKKQNREDLIPLTEPSKSRPDSDASIGIKLRTKESKKSRRSRDGLDYNCLKKTVEHLQYETMSLRESLAEEQMARRKMEKFIRSSLKGIVPDLKWEEFKDEM